MFDDLEGSQILAVRLYGRTQSLLATGDIRYSDYESALREYKELLNNGRNLPQLQDIENNLRALRLKARVSLNGEIAHLNELIVKLEEPIPLPELVKVALVQPSETVSGTQKPPEVLVTPATRVNNDLKHDGAIQDILAFLIQHQGKDLTYDRIYEEFPSYDHHYIMDTLGRLKKRGVKEGRLVGGYGKIRFEKSDGQTVSKGNPDGQSGVPPTEVEPFHGERLVRYEKGGKRPYLDKDHIRRFSDIYQEVSGVYGNAGFADILQGMNGFHSAIINARKKLPAGLVHPFYSLLHRVPYDQRRGRRFSEILKLISIYPERAEELLGWTADQQNFNDSRLESKLSELSRLTGYVGTNGRPDHNRVRLVDIGDDVIIHDMDTGQRYHYIIVDPKGGGIEDGQVSYKSPLGSVLLGKRMGEKLEVRVPEGVKHYEVKEIL